MASGNREVIASTVFVPVAAGPVTSAYMRNCAGTTTPGVPDRIGVGNWQVFIPGALDQLRISVTARAYNAAGTNLIVTAVIDTGLQPTVDPTLIDIFVRTDAGALVEVGVLFVEVTISRLPQ